ncbi:hypothetical protein GCM10020254_26900 [Streptomyces goshikiensis]
MTDKTAGGDVRLAGISKHYGSFTAVHPLDLTIPQGSFFALLGASGCGKTTTLRMIAGLEEPSTGTVSLGDREVTQLPPYKRPVNTVFQSYALFPHLNIYENVAFGLRRRGIKSVKKQVEDMLELVELGQFAQRKPHQLSGGQQQRVAVARALINHPQVLLLDEPLGALDLKLRRQMQLELKRIQTEVGITFVHVTHDQEEAMTMADTVAVMNGGRVEQLGAPRRSLREPEDHLRRQLPRHLQPHRGRGPGGRRRRRHGRLGGRHAAAARGPMFDHAQGRRKAAGRGASREDIPGPRGRGGHRRGRPQQDPRHDSRLLLHRRLHPVRHRQPRLPGAGGVRPEHRARRTPRPPAPRWSCTGTRSTPSASMPLRT